MNFLLILLALLIVGIAALSVVALGGERAVPGAAFFSGVGRDGLGTFDRVEDLTTSVRFFGNPEGEKVSASESASSDASAEAAAESAEGAAEPVRRVAVPLADDAESTLSAHDFVEKRKNPQAEGALSVAEGS
ncbi:taurine ABC transporter substrate-binding protein [Rothia sp. HMSC066G07]|uniref:taurine ABC transporter substrate-binding protein n=1 Tax=Rothia sp. HMSC066G07 TaxID=1739475 RepID=UPI0008A3EF05|nr:taurine ABC transporter substrate-binding protein [Rothia sp. HMSC066G07]MDU2570865.1 taurine ABC transporter substrate-binding protein [Rothia mucilaginosa]OFP77064.1 taurine ABC transporter substrate-binding protein [Rothia sp. HMSC066G07]